MDYRQFGRSGLAVPVLSFGTGTFGGTNEYFQPWGQTDVPEATRMVDLFLDFGVSFFDTADIYSAGASEEILGQALRRGPWSGSAHGRRLRVASPDHRPSRPPGSCRH